MKSRFPGGLAQRPDQGAQGGALPIINCVGAFPDDSIVLRALMHWPGTDEANRRRHFYAADVTNGRYGGAPRDLFVPTDAGTLNDLLDAPSWLDLVEQMKVRTKRGMAAGHVFLAIYLMSLWGERLPLRGKPASIARAIGVVDYWARNGATWGDGSPVERLTKVKDSWRTHRSVAHLWGALALNQMTSFVPSDEIFRPEGFHLFMRTASYLQCFGLAQPLPSTVDGHAETVLNSQSLWRIDLSKFPARMGVPQFDPRIAESVLFKALAAHPK